MRLLSFVLSMIDLPNLTHRPDGKAAVGCFVCVLPVDGGMLDLQGLAVQPFLGYAFPGDDPITSSPHLVLPHHLFQKILGLLFLLSNDLQLLTGCIVLREQISGGVRQGDVGSGRTAGETLGQELRTCLVSSQLSHPVIE